MVTLEDNSKAQELQEVDLYEISAVTVPANDDASVVDVKAGRRNSSADEEKIKEAISLLQDLLGQLDQDEDNNGEDGPKDNAAAEDQTESNPKKAQLLEYIKSL